MNDEPLAAAHGTHRRIEGGAPLCDLFVSLGQRMGVGVDRFGDSRGALRL
jgi:hypothetical protein